MLKVRKTRNKNTFMIKKVKDGKLVNIKSFETKEEAMIAMNQMLEKINEENKNEDTEIEDIEIKN